MSKERLYQNKVLLYLKFIIKLWGHSVRKNELNNSINGDICTKKQI